MARTKIEWTEYSWNPVTGCSKISPGCVNCYAERFARRLTGRCGYPADEPFRVTLHPERLEEPLRWKKPRRVFVCSMGDLFHEDVPDEFLLEIFEVMVNTPMHTYMILTKRPQRMHDFISRLGVLPADNDNFNLVLEEGQVLRLQVHSNIWLGVTAENQEAADKRIPILLQIPAAVRFVSVEPMLGPVDLTSIDLGDKVTQGYGPRRIIWDALIGWEKQYPPGKAPKPMPEQFPMCMSNDIGGKLHWVICGGETGPNARPMHPDWVRSLRDQCQAAEIPFFFKSWGEYLPCDQEQASAFLDGTKEPLFAPNPEDYSVKVGKKAAGRILDRRTWDEIPEVAG